MRRKAKQGQHCFVACDVERHHHLQRIICMWESKAHEEKDKGLILTKVSALSQQDQDYYQEQKNHFQTIADTYTAWYGRHQEILQKRNDTYFYCDPWEVDFEVTSGALETPLDGFLNET